jgi:arylsulfatase A-like enzyme
MRREADDPTLPGGIVVTLRAAISAGAVAGLVFGLVDGIVAARIGTADLGPWSAIECVAASVTLYSLVFVGALVPAGLALHAWLRRRIAAQRYLALLCVAFSLGVFCEAYWWTRPLVLYGHSSVSPERLAATLGIFAAAVAVGIALARGLTRLAQGFQLGLSIALCAAWLVGGVYLLTRAGVAAERGAIDARNRDMPNVLLIVVDALRQDVLSCYGNTRVRTPSFDALAAQGVLFENEFTQAPFTWASFGSILTGKYPRRHGLVAMRPGVHMTRDNVTLPLWLKRAKKKDGTGLASDDYLGATFHTGTLSTGSGLLNGFDMYFEAMAGHDLVSLDDPWSVFRSDLLLFIFKNKLSQRFDSGIVASEARKWLARNAGRRFVCMVHLYSTHTPYDPPAEFKRQYCDPQYAGPFHSFYAQHREKIESGEYTPTAADREQIKDLYYAGVAQADALIGDIVHELERAGVRDQTLVVATSDHGESLGEQGLWEHNHMVQTNLRVPLVMSWPGHLPAGKRVSALTDEIDILPTICDLASIELPADEDKYAHVDGTSLLPLVRGDKPSVREFSFAENGFWISIQDAHTKLVAYADSIQPGAWEESLRGGAKKPQLFDVVADPGESRNLIDSRGDEAKRLIVELRAWDGRMPVPRQDTAVSERERKAEAQRLNGLGYTEGGIGAHVTTDAGGTKTPQHK